MNIKNRKKVEKLVYDTLKHLDPSGLNSEKYKKTFSTMSDKDFLTFWKRIKTDDTAHLYVETDLYGKNKITMESIKETSKFLKVPLEERINLKHKTADGSVITTERAVPVMYLHMKRMQQLLSKKNRMNADSDSGNKRSSITGGLNSSEKTGRYTDADIQALMSIISPETQGYQDRDNIILNVNNTPMANTIRPTNSLSTSAIHAELKELRSDNRTKASMMQQYIAAGVPVDTSAISATANAHNPLGASSSQATTSLFYFYLAAGMELSTGANGGDAVFKSLVLKQTASDDADTV